MIVDLVAIVKVKAEATKLWYFSQAALADMLDEELETGGITFPEGA